MKRDEGVERGRGNERGGCRGGEAELVGPGGVCVCVRAEIPTNKV